MAFRTQKISQMTPKGADLEATDLIEVSTIESGSYVTRSITGQELIDAIPLPPTGLTVGTTPISSGTIGRVLFQGTGNVLQQSSSLFWDDAQVRFQLGATSTRILNFRPEDTTGAYGNSSSIRGGNGNGRLDFYSATNITELRDNIIILTSLGGPSVQVGSSSIALNLGGTRLQVAPTTGNVLINTTTDAGFRLDVNGTARVQNTFTVTKSGSNNFFTFEPSATGTAPFLQAFFQGAVDARMYFDSGALKLRVAGTSILYGLDCGNILANGNIQLNGGTEHKLHLAGSTNNYIQYTDAGAINIGVIGTADATSYIQVRTGGATNMSTGTLSTAFFNTGNVGINTTTDAGFKLDVNGTARVSVASGTLLSQFTVISSLSRLDISPYDNTTYGVILRPSTNNGGSFVPISLWGTKIQLEAPVHISANATGPNSSAQLDVTSTTKGFLPPRLTTTQKNAIATPATGLQVYDTTLNQMSYYNGTTWTNI